MIRRVARGLQINGERSRRLNEAQGGQEGTTARTGLEIQAVSTSSPWTREAGVGPATRLSLGPLSQLRGPLFALLSPSWLSGSLPAVLLSQGTQRCPGPPAGHSVSPGTGGPHPTQPPGPPPNLPAPRPLSVQVPAASLRAAGGHGPPGHAGTLELLGTAPLLSGLPNVTLYILLRAGCGAEERTSLRPSWWLLGTQSRPLPGAGARRPQDGIAWAPASPSASGLSKLPRATAASHHRAEATTEPPWVMPSLFPGSHIRSLRALGHAPPRAAEQAVFSCQRPCPDYQLRAS
ncbi:uncharacterized protein LOC132654168 [Meriones unguiculatus]|uniref:uncharacterized protein LOC132654168 n=1 Tax=Meriones unguiculatus TaxID=10047 RepID=UPI00293ECA7C|nr:uncharacterized protein LOC132654168 [Meriones unguiculatus]